MAAAQGGQSTANSDTLATAVFQAILSQPRLAKLLHTVEGFDPKELEHLIRDRVAQTSA